MTTAPTAVVTGAARGLGRQIAVALAGRGYQVLCTNPDGVGSEAAARDIGRGAWAMAQDVRDPDSHHRVAAAAAARGPLKVWINNAGVLTVGPAWDSTEDELRRMFDINVLGVMWGSRAAVAAMRDGGGHIINIASMAAHVPAPGFSGYSASKSAALAYTIALAGDLRRAGIPIEVTALCPDAIETDMVRQVEHDAASDVLFSSSQLLRAEDVAAEVLASLDHPRLVRTLPPTRGALAHLLHPFPALGLRLLERFTSAGARRKAKRATESGGS